MGGVYVIEGEGGGRQVVSENGVVSVVDNALVAIETLYATQKQLRD